MYLSYSDTSSLSLQTVAGNVSLGAAAGAAPTLLGLAQSNLQGSTLGAGVFPGSLSVSAPGGNILFGPGIGNNGSVTLYPAPQGQLDLEAGDDIRGGTGLITLSDAVADSFATAAMPLNQGPLAGPGAAFIGGIHGADTQPALVTAGGSITNLELSIPKATHISAGVDIIDLTYLGQNLNPGDATLIEAGRDFVFGNSNDYVSVGGPGRLAILAGRNVSLGLSQGGLITTGNLENANLPSAQGANLTVATGLGTSPDFAGFLAKIIAPSSGYQAALVSYVENLQGSSKLSFANAEQVFESLSADDQRPLIDSVFFDELSASGLAANSASGGNFAQGYAAIDALFPGSRSAAAGALRGWAGDLTLDFSRIYTLSGGNIDLLVPGGLINVGLANPPAQLTVRPASTLGIVAQGTGDVDIYSRGDVDVNASRIFTLGGGNILIWSDEGSHRRGTRRKNRRFCTAPHRAHQQRRYRVDQLLGCRSGQRHPHHPNRSVHRGGQCRLGCARRHRQCRRCRHRCCRQHQHRRTLRGWPRQYSIRRDGNRCARADQQYRGFIVWSIGGSRQREQRRDHIRERQRRRQRGGGAAVPGRALLARCFCDRTRRRKLQTGRRRLSETPTDARQLKQLASTRSLVVTKRSRTMPTMSVLFAAGAGTSDS